MSKSILILYATMTGNAEFAAKRVASAAEKRGFIPKVSDVNGHKFEDIAREPRVALVVSTYGEGDPPPDAEDFRDWLEAQSEGVFGGVQFSVYALGDTSYESFCGFGKTVDAEFERLGARRVAERWDNDLDFEDNLNEWIDKALAAFDAAKPASV
ncbi:MAG TPA: flavodoxin domain-containing protein [Chthoniobacterales bacterium]